ncbi:hypothetical protein [Nocardioides alkalitolerans]|uniref:hypothetical protein n=1 Tax=Nocardioides alkalitolerans TaxID=281714 RepID=UPI0012FA0F7F|nr:hypothetical protein [Nocardioides alkalitolerans]
MSSAPGRVPSATTRLAQPKHVWVDLSGAFGGTQVPGLMVMWRRWDRRGGSVWQAWVVYALPVRPGDEGPLIRQGWVDAALLRAAPTLGGPGS